MARQRLILFAGLAIALFLLSGQTAMAAGWWRENPIDTINLDAGNGAHNANGYWADQADNSIVNMDDSYNSPHRGFTTTSNRCKTCHALHGAFQNSYRLLRNVSRDEECNYCHMGPTGASILRLYALDDLGFAVKGEHTLGSTEIPDSNVNAGINGIGNLPDRGGPYDDAGRQALYCYSCHTVHGANALSHDYGWAEKLLRRDPAGNGGSADNGLQGDISGRILRREDGATIDVSQVRAADVRVDSKTWGAQVKAAFCGDCHTKNYNFRVNFGNSPGTVFGLPQQAGKDYTLNRQSHPMNTNGWLHVSGGAGTTGYIRVASDMYKVEWCGICHSSSSTFDYGTQPAGTGGDPWGQEWTVVAFPHQGKGNKFFDDDYTDGDRDATQTNDAYEPLDNLATNVCMQCHEIGTESVGQAF